jgi:arginyl-tRNA synthetase
LCRFSEAFESCVSEFRPNLLTQYLFETANLFSTFYNECSVLQAGEAAVRQSRLLLCDLTARVLAGGLNLLGIGTSEQM